MSGIDVYRTRVKICGITRPEDAVSAAAAGVDAIGLVFYPPSPRGVTIAQAAAIIEAVPPFVTKVALFVDAGRERVHEVLAALSIDLLQFHGSETPEACGGFGRNYIKALRMRPGLNLQQAAGDYHAASGLLLDSYEKGVPGGTGHAFDWARIPAGLTKPVILAGGITPENVAEAIRTSHPYAIDVSSGVEINKGIKSADKMTDLMQRVRSSDE